jgi:hypothetical protein
MLNPVPSRRILPAIIVALALCVMPVRSSAGIAVSITIAPPILPVYVQPACPAPGYIWTPGYWAWGPDGYYWVPGVWVLPPRVGLLWTPGYWGYAGGIYVWHPGYWGPHVGFYGGVNYGFGYFGVGFAGGFWSGGVFRYNAAVLNVNAAVVRNVYVDRTVIRNTPIINRVSYNGPGGVMAQPTFQERMAMREQHFQPTAAQISHRDQASRDRMQLASYNHGRPPVTSMDTIDGRRYNQQARIANGIRSGELTPGETVRAERREQNINRNIAADRRANDGHLTPAERRQINREQNQASRQIYREKHNDRTDR